MLTLTLKGSKRDIVDTCFHASCLFGHDHALGLGIPSIRGMGGLLGWLQDLELEIWNQNNMGLINAMSEWHYE